jgi:hypothetical protein
VSPSASVSIAERGGTSVMSRRELGATSQAVVDSHRGTPPVPQGYSPGPPTAQPFVQPVAQPFVDPRSMPVPDAVPSPQRSRLGLWMAIVIVLAAVAGISVGLVLGGG